MSPPVSPEYLALALQDGRRVNNMTLIHRHIADLALPTGQLVACDAMMVILEMEPFNMPLPRGTFPCVLSVAQLSDDQRVAFATVRFGQNAPVTWRMMTFGAQAVSALEEGAFFGYPVDSGTGCFMDRSAGPRLAETMEMQEEEFFETILSEMEKTYTHTWSWLDMKFGDANLIAFDSGWGDGVYATYAGLDAQDRVAVVVTDFAVIDCEAIKT
jgi:hypothetical protein